MKCELCHKADAETAIIRGEGEGAEELYVCKACANAERVRRQQKSQRTRKVTGLPPGVSMSITEISGTDEEGEPPPFIGAIMNAFQDIVSDIEKSKNASPKKNEEYHEFPIARVDSEFRVCNRLHLEGLHLIGELDAVKRSMRALKMELVGVSSDGVNESGHVYSLRYTGSIESARRVVGDILREERNARTRLSNELPRVFGDSLCRALAILKNCRLLSFGELFDLLSPIRLGAMEDLLDGIDLEEVERLIAECDLTGFEDRLEQAERDRIDSERADAINRRFENVVLNERAEGKYL